MSADGRLFMWGWNDNGQLGLGDTTGRTTPTVVTALEGRRVVEVKLFYKHSFAIVGACGCV